MRRPADASIKDDDDIVGIVLRPVVTAIAEQRSPPTAHTHHDLILVDNSEWLAGGTPGSSQGEEFRVRFEGRDP